MATQRCTPPLTKRRDRLSDRTQLSSMLSKSSQRSFNGPALAPTALSLRKNTSASSWRLVWSCALQSTLTSWPSWSRRTSITTLRTRMKLRTSKVSNSHPSFWTTWMRRNCSMGFSSLQTLGAKTLTNTSTRSYLDTLSTRWSTQVKTMITPTTWCLEDYCNFILNLTLSINN